MHTIRGCSFELKRALDRHYRPIDLRQPLQECVLRKRGIFHIGAAPEAFIVQDDDDRAAASVDHERRARIAIPLEIAIDVGGHEPLRPGHAVERETEQSAHSATGAVCTDEPPSAQFVRFAPRDHRDSHPLSILLKPVKSGAEQYRRVRAGPQLAQGNISQAILAQMQVVGVGRMPCQHLHRILDALAGASDEIRVVLLAHTGSLGLLEYSQASETLENRPEVHRRARGIDDLRFGFDDSDANSGLRQTESVDKADWPATDDDHVLHGAVSGSSWPGMRRDGGLLLSA